MNTMMNAVLVPTILLVGVAGLVLDLPAKDIVAAQMGAYTIYLTIDYVNQTWLTRR